MGEWSFGKQKVDATKFLSENYQIFNTAFKAIKLNFYNFYNSQFLKNATTILDKTNETLFKK